MAFYNINSQQSNKQDFAVSPKNAFLEKPHVGGASNCRHSLFRVNVCLHCLMSDSKGRFLVNNILMLGTV